MQGFLVAVHFQNGLKFLRYLTPPWTSLVDFDDIPILETEMKSLEVVYESLGV